MEQATVKDSHMWKLWITTEEEKTFSASLLLDETYVARPHSKQLTSEAGLEDRDFTIAHELDEGSSNFDEGFLSPF